MRKIIFPLLFVASCAPTLPPRTATVRMDAYCAPKEDDAHTAYRAIRLDNKPALIRLASTGRILALQSGDQVVVIAEYDGFTRVRMTSSVYIGERCWIPSGFLSK